MAVCIRTYITIIIIIENPCAMNHLQESSYAGGPTQKIHVQWTLYGIPHMQGSHSNNSCAIDPILYYSYAGGPTQRIYVQWTLSWSVHIQGAPH